MTDDDPFYAPTHRVRPLYAPPAPGQPVWTMRKKDHTIVCEYRSHGEYGWETQFFRDGQLLLGQRFTLRAHAEELAAEKRRELEARGWESVGGS